MRYKTTGLQNVLMNLNAEIHAIEGRSLHGLIRATIIIRRSMEKQEPLTPIDWGNLRASWFVTTSTGKTEDQAQEEFKGPDAAKLIEEHPAVVQEALVLAKSFGQPTVAIGYSAGYAWYVHEMVGAEFKRPGAGPKFLEAALLRERQAMLNIIQKTAKIR